MITDSIDFLPLQTNYIIFTRKILLELKVLKNKLDLTVMIRSHYNKSIFVISTFVCVFLSGREFKSEIVIYSNNFKFACLISDFHVYVT